jgi:uncharacterized protein (TIGR03545 family)
MKAIIRWQGLGVFGFVAALICLFTLFFIDTIIKGIIEKQGSALVGARVELAEADLTFFPAGLQLSRLQITNPDKPLRNIVEIDRIAMAFDAVKLLQRKIIIDQMAMEGIRPDTPRRKSGALPEYSARKKTTTPGSSKEGFQAPKLQIPDIKEILAKEKLASLELAKSFQAQIKEDTLKWRQQLAELPDESKLAQYKERLNKVKSSSGLAGLLGGATELLAVRKEIQADLDRLQTARKDIVEVSASYKKRLAELQNAPRQDIKRLVDEYSLSGKGLANLSSLLFGAKTGDIIEQALAWYAKAQPLLERSKEKKDGSEIVKPLRGKGIWVRFEEREPLPDFLIRNIAASVEIAAGSFEGTIKNVTPDQDVLGAPLSFTFAGDSLQGLRAISFDGVLDHVNPARSRDTVNLEIIGYGLGETVLSDDENLPLTINSGLVDLAVQAVFQQHDINAELAAKLQSATFTAPPPQQSGVISQAIAGALSNTTNLTASARITGTIDDYNIELSSDLDSILKQAVANSIKGQTARFKQDLKDGVMDKVKGPLAAATGSFSDFGSIAKELTTRLQVGDNLL